MTDAAIILEAKAALRINGTTLDTYCAQRLNRIYRTYCRKNNWPQLLVRDATITTTANTSAYDLPALFDRFAGDTINYGVTAATGGYVYGSTIQIFFSGNETLNNRLASYQRTGVVADPLVAYVAAKPATPGTMQLVFSPSFTTASKIILYSYYKQPEPLTGGGVIIEVDALGETLLAALCKDLAKYHGGDRMEEASYHAQQERAEYAAALRTLFAS